MRFIRTVAGEEVLAVTPDGAATRAEIIQRANEWGEWECDRSDVATIGSQDPFNPARLAPLAELYGERVRWMHEGTPAALRDLRTHVHFLEELIAGRSVAQPIIITNAACGWNKQIIDGAHRLFALYEHMAHAAALRQLVFWNARQ